MSYDTTNLNRDPITGEPGAHPVGTGVGAAGGAAAGAALGMVGGPVAQLWAAWSELSRVVSQARGRQKP